MRCESAIVFTAEQRAELQPACRDAKPLAGDEVEGKTLFSLISAGTELNMYLGNYLREGLGWGTFPLTPGYAAMFEVDRIGSDVKDVRVGDLMFSTGRHRTWQREPRAHSHLLPKGLTPEKALFARMMNVTMSALTITAARPPAPVMITGLGVVGLIGGLVFQRTGYAVFACEPIEERAELARQLGLTRVFTKVPFEDAKYAGQAALALECSGFEQATVDCCAMVKKGGEVIQVGVPMVRRSELYAQELMLRIFRNNVTYRGGSEWQSAVCHPQMAGALEWLSDGSIRVDGIYEIRSPENPQQTYQSILRKETTKPCVILDWRKEGVRS